MNCRCLPSFASLPGLPGDRARRRRARAADGRRLRRREVDADRSPACRSRCSSPSAALVLLVRAETAWPSTAPSSLDPLRALHEGAGAGRLGRRDRHVGRLRAAPRSSSASSIRSSSLLATLGMMVMVSANDLIALYLGLELQSLALYVVAAINRDIRPLDRGRPQIFRPRRAVLGHAALRRLADLRLHRPDPASPASPRRSPAASASIGLIFGLVFLLAGLAFKISAVPFHMWTPDVYEGAPTPVTAFFAAAPKVAAMALFVRVVIGAVRADRRTTGSRSSSSSRSPRWCSAPSPPSARTTSSA